MSVEPVEVGLFRSPPEFRNFSMDRYATELRGALERLDGNDLVFRETRLARSALAESLGGSHAPFPVRFFRRFPASVSAARRSRFGINHILDHANAHLLYGLDAGRTVVTCHDIFPLKHWRGDIRGMRRRRRPPLTVMLSLSALRRAAAVITDTAATRDDLIEILGVAEGRIRVIAPGVATAFRQGVTDAYDHLDTRRIGQTILVVDTGAQYKNQRATVEVLARVRGALGDGVTLTRVGTPLPPEDRRRAIALGVEQAIVELGGVPESELRRLYMTASVLLFPSYFEGFGWPPLEAMACGLPVVCSTAKALSEVVEGAALQADPDDHEELARHVLAVLNDERLAASLRKRGLERVAIFEWERTARETVSVYEQVLAAAG